MKFLKLLPLLFLSSILFLSGCKKDVESSPASVQNTNNLTALSPEATGLLAEADSAIENDFSINHLVGTYRGIIYFDDSL